ncbi:16S rRNA (cytidine1402-2'-O)-methyltransferase [Tibeticola sediminis]|jgi:16S rRNA (cytidine1402-2'-O)-methyltransferase|uniref:16S rRNA (Cytidine1402-2'-O)-methyltransferase n=1 Tax=Tibeticola sediminis TaxID=1917811 RepID=A0A3N4UV22_9BURK|nr:SAM-dependent methyltransferase [Tibeticola sediminis]RPE64534.1 16S rRNA (cytidine1402-2'-O)-methyltransferase [Tibeticola sediminis]
MTQPSKTSLSDAVGQPAAPRLGRLFLVPAPLDHGCAEPTRLEDSLPSGTLAAAAQITHWICENARSARAYLKRISAIVPLAAPLQAQHITELPRLAHKKGDHSGAAGAEYDAAGLLEAARAGADMGLLSEAGMPGIADPGSAVVRAAHRLGLPVIPLVGPVSPVLALAASGLNGQNFAFIGYLPQNPDERVQRIRALEAYAIKTGQTQLFIETPYRNRALLQALVQTLAPQTLLAVAWGVTLPGGRIISQPVSAWRTMAIDAVAAEWPAVFAIGR